MSIEMANTGGAQPLPCQECYAQIGSHRTGCSKLVPTEADVWRAEADYKRRALLEVRARIATLYSERGEDLRVAELCNQVLRIIDVNS